MRRSAGGAAADGGLAQQDAGRAGAGQAGARDLVAISEGINRFPLLSKNLDYPTFKESKYFKSITNLDNKLIEIASKITNEIIDNPPLSITGIIEFGVILLKQLVVYV